MWWIALAAGIITLGSFFGWFLKRSIWMSANRSLVETNVKAILLGKGSMSAREIRNILKGQGLKMSRGEFNEFMAQMEDSGHVKGWIGCLSRERYYSPRGAKPA